MAYGDSLYAHTAFGMCGSTVAAGTITGVSVPVERWLIASGFVSTVGATLVAARAFHHSGTDYAINATIPGLSSVQKIQMLKSGHLKGS